MYITFEEEQALLAAVQRFVSDPHCAACKNAITPDTGWKPVIMQHAEMPDEKIYGISIALYCAPCFISGEAERDIGQPLHD